MASTSTGLLVNAKSSSQFPGAFAEVCYPGVASLRLGEHPVGKGEFGGNNFIEVCLLKIDSSDF